MPTELCPDIRNLTLPELRNWLVRAAEPAYRAAQVFDWLYRKGARSFSEMVNIPLGLRRKLEESFSVTELQPAVCRKSRDGTEKFRLELPDGSCTESVAIPGRDRFTACVSTQVGCRFKCAFCASGRRGFTRDLNPAEIVGQIIFLRHQRRMPVDHVVVMGMGEPFDNYANLVQALGIINCREGLNIGARKITVSTCGLAPQIEQFAELDLQVQLAVSLHAGNDTLRSQLVPANRKYPLAELIRACETYLGKTGRKMTLEYALLRNVNDSEKQADKLADIAKRLKAKINLIRFNPVPGFDYYPSEGAQVDRFARRLAERAVPFTVRLSRGGDINAACGQLAGRSDHERDS